MSRVYLCSVSLPIKRWALFQMGVCDKKEPNKERYLALQCYLFAIIVDNVETLSQQEKGSRHLQRVRHPQALKRLITAREAFDSSLQPAESRTSIKDERLSLLSAKEKPKKKREILTPISEVKPPGSAVLLLCRYKPIQIRQPPLIANHRGQFRLKKQQKKRSGDSKSPSWAKPQPTRYPPYSYSYTIHYSHICALHLS